MMKRPNFLSPVLTINVPQGERYRGAVISPAISASVASPLSPTRTRRQQTKNTRALRPRRSGVHLRVPTEAAAHASADAFMEELSREATLTPSRSQLGTSTTAVTEDTAPQEEKEKEEESPQLAADDLFEIQEFLARKSWIQEKIRVLEAGYFLYLYSADIRYLYSCMRLCPTSMSSPVLRNSHPHRIPVSLSPVSQIRINTSSGWLNKTQSRRKWSISTKVSGPPSL